MQVYVDTHVHTPAQSLPCLLSDDELQQAKDAVTFALQQGHQSKVRNICICVCVYVCM